MAGDDSGHQQSSSSSVPDDRPSLKREDRVRWLCFLQLPGIRPRARITLLEQFGSLEALFGAPRHALGAAIGANPVAMEMIRSGPNLDTLGPALDWLEQPNHHLLTWFDEDYPPLLRQIEDPPAALYVFGNPSLLRRPLLAIVGSRNPTPGGRENAYAFARALAQAGVGITSGLAMGIDGAAHEGALAAGGATVAVAGTGLDRVYPPRHRPLAHRIAATGALISEFPLGTPPRSENFPIRNRLISGVSLGTLVVEAAVKSGSLITARLAGEQGREVFAIPGSIHSPLSRGCHALIRQGAKLIETASDVLEELGPLARAAVLSDSVIEREATSALNAASMRLLECVGYEPTAIDTLVERSGLTPDTVSSMLLQLELQGHVAACPGGTYQRTSR